jgi:hypothetical protein
LCEIVKKKEKEKEKEKEKKKQSVSWFEKRNNKIKMYHYVLNYND